MDRRAIARGHQRDFILELDAPYGSVGEGSGPLGADPDQPPPRPRRGRADRRDHGAARPADIAATTDRADPPDADSIEP